MVEGNLNDGTLHRVDLAKPVFCAKCRKEIVRLPGCNTVDLVVDVHDCGYAFCKKCRKALVDFAGKKVAAYEKKLVEEFVNDR